MSNDFEENDNKDSLRATRKAERRERQRQRQQQGPVVARYGVWTGEGYLREGEGLEKELARRSLTVEGETPSKRRSSKKKTQPQP